ncbi:MAG: PcfB family protein [Mogibacterium sp.]|nr:PcfB family protein [Mogibacterium sp.]
MNPGGDAAEQVVRLSLEGVEVAAKITGNGAKNISLLLLAALKEEKKTKGKARLTSMLKSGKELKVYTITQNDLAKFSQEAKRYGVLYCVLKDRQNKDPNAAVDVIARAEDASKIQRITERFRLTTVSKADVSVDAQRDRERLFPQDPSVAKTERDHLSEPKSTQDSHSTGKTGRTSRPSVREKLNEYKAEIARNRSERTRELAKDMVSGGLDAARDAAKAVPIPKAPGKDR